MNTDKGETIATSTSYVRYFDEHGDFKHGEFYPSKMSDGREGFTAFIWDNKKAIARGFTRKDGEWHKILVEISRDRSDQLLEIDRL